MQTFTMTVEPDGRIVVPGAKPGQTITIHIEFETREEPSLADRTPEEQKRVVQALVAGGQRVREAADPEWLKLDHGEWLYGPDGLPR